jgi:hypothetical protein
MYNAHIIFTNRNIYIMYSELICSFKNQMVRPK